MELIGAGREAEVYAVSDDVCLKLFYADRPANLIEREAGIMKYISTLPIPSPRYLDAVVQGDRRGILMQRLHGRSVLAELLENPDSAERLGEQMGTIQRAFHGISVAGRESAAGHIEWAINRTALLTDAEKGVMLARFSAMPDGDRLLHTDYHIDNLIVTGEGLMVIDWSGASCGNPLADVARTYMTCLPGAYPVYATPDMCIQIDDMRARLRIAYLRGYGVGEAEFAEWLPIIAASRLYCAPPEEIAVNMKIIKDSL